MYWSMLYRGDVSRVEEKHRRFRTIVSMVSVADFRTIALYSLFSRVLDWDGANRRDKPLVRVRVFDSSDLLLHRTSYYRQTLLTGHV